MEWVDVYHMLTGCIVDTRDLYLEDAVLYSGQAEETEKESLYCNQETRKHPLWLEQGIEGMVKAFFFFSFSSFFSRNVKGKK